MAIETGVWIVMVVIASAFTFFSLKTVGKTMIGFSMLAVAIWMMVGVIHAGGLEVSSTTQIQSAIDVNGTLTPVYTNSTNIFIPEGTQASFISWIFFAFALFAMFNVIRSYGLINGL